MEPVLDRAHVVQAMAALRAGVLAERQGAAYGSRLVELVRVACATYGLDERAWWSTLAIDADLAALFDGLLLELATDPPDVGPYDVISRESPSGGPECDAFDRDARLLGRRHRG